MKILLLSKVPAHYEQFRKKDQPFPNFQSQTFWLRALNQIGHKTKTFRYSDPIFFPLTITTPVTLFFQNLSPTLYAKYRNFKNKHYSLFPDNIFRTNKLIKLLKQHQPEIIIISGGVSELRNEVLTIAKSFGTKIILLHGENPRTSATWFEKTNVKLFDLIVTNDPTHATSWKKIGAHQSIGLPYAGIDPQVHNKMTLSLKQRQQYTCDVCFVGTLFTSRQQQIAKLLSLGFNLKAWGFLPENHLIPELKSAYQGESWGNKTNAIFNAAKIVLNFVPEHMSVGGNMRTFEIPGAGSFQLANRCPDSWYKQDKEIVLFSNFDQLTNKISYYLKNTDQRNKIAQSGYKKTHQLYTYTQRFDKILNLVTNLDQTPQKNK